QEMNLLIDVIRAVRNIRAEVNVPMSKKVGRTGSPSGRRCGAAMSPICRSSRRSVCWTPARGSAAGTPWSSRSTAKTTG
ncbi:hypothetical protein, partial [Paenibacillus macerans]|uniref:hypothetical protein n=1 Tax=Paenibacillus macerans TaxID=44252 RepID=UPI003D313F49